MHHRPSDQEICDLWKRLWALRHRLDEQTFSDASEAEFSDTMILVAETALRLRTLVQKRPLDSEKILTDLRREMRAEDVD